MPRKSKKQRNIRKLQRTGMGGRSIMLTLPKVIVEELGWKERQKVVVKRRGKSVVITDWE